MILLSLMETKTCRLCGLDLPSSEFYQTKGVPYKHCKACHKKKVNKYLADETNREKHRQRCRDYKNRIDLGLDRNEWKAQFKPDAKQPETSRVCRCCKVNFPISEFYKNKKGWIQKECKECFKEKVNKYLDDENNREKHRQRCKQYYMNNKERILAKNAEWRTRNMDLFKTLTAEWREKNKEKDRAYRYAYFKARQARVKEATPSWANQKDLAKIEIDARMLRCGGHDVHVDHIIPIRGKNVCGLHVPWNLLIIPAQENLRKNAKVDQSKALAYPDGDGPI